jgi:flagellar biosynthesis chaperone FliJ
MRRPPYPFASVLTRAEEDRDEHQRAYLRRRESWRAQQRAVQGHETALGEVVAHLSAQRAAGPRGAMEQNYLLYVGRERRRLLELRQRERILAVETEKARQQLLEAALKVRVWETLRERFWKEWERLQRRREEAELEDWSRSRLQPPRSRAVV